MQNKNISSFYFFCGMLFVTCLIVSNIIAQKLINVFSIETTAGFLIFPISYILNDLVAEVWGYQKAKKMILYGFFMNFLAVGFFQIAILLPSNSNFAYQEAFSLILGSSLRISISSFAAFLIGSLINAYVISRMKVWQKGKSFSIRAVVSTLMGEGADSLVFFVLAFLGVVPLKTIFVLIITQTLMKTAYEIVLLPITVRLVKYVKTKENTDFYDN